MTILNTRLLQVRLRPRVLPRPRRLRLRPQYRVLQPQARPPQVLLPRFQQVLQVRQLRLHLKEA